MDRDRDDGTLGMAWRGADMGGGKVVVTFGVSGFEYRKKQPSGASFLHRSGIKNGSYFSSNMLPPIGRAECGQYFFGCSLSTLGPTNRARRVPGKIVAIFYAGAME